MMIYSYPSGLEVIGGLDEQDLDYAWHTLGVFRKVDTDEYFWIEDSGCSCDGPFEGHGLKDYAGLTVESWAEFEKAVRDFPADEVEKAALLHGLKRRLGIFG